MGYDKRFKRFQEFVEDTEPIEEDGAVGVPANAAGNAGVAGIGQPPGSKFGEPPGPAPLGGYTSGKKRKHYKEATNYNSTPDTIDASELGWRPGQWPNKFTFTGASVPVNTPGYLSYVYREYIRGGSVKDREGDLLYVLYKNKNGDILHVFNEDVEKPRYSPTNRRPVGKIDVEFTRIRSNKQWGGLETTYIAKTLVPSANGMTKSGAESKPQKNVLAAFEDLKDQLINRYYVTGTITIKRSSSDQVLNREIDGWMKAFKRTNESKQEGIVVEWDQTPKPIEGGEQIKSQTMEEITKAALETAAAAVHNRWLENQIADGETEHKSPDGKEDYMVPYKELSQKSKEMDREAVRATVDALGLDEGAKDEHKDDELETCMACDGRGVDWGETCVTCGGAGKYWVNKKTGRFVDYALNEESGDDDWGWEREWKKGAPRPKGECPECEGSGIDAGKKCRECGGTGKRKIEEERETFAGAPVFEVDTDKWMKSRFGKNRYHRYSRYVGEDDKGEEIRQHGRTKRKDDIILKDQATGAMTYFLRRKKRGQG